VLGIHHIFSHHSMTQVKLGKDNSPSSLMDHLYIHHLQEYNSQTTNLLGWKKSSKMVSALSLCLPKPWSMSKYVSPRKTYFLDLFCSLGKMFEITNLKNESSGIVVFFEFQYNQNCAFSPNVYYRNIPGPKEPS